MTSLHRYLTKNIIHLQVLDFPERTFSRHEIGEILFAKQKKKEHISQMYKFRSSQNCHRYPAPR